jgi:hypothetical protein
MGLKTMTTVFARGVVDELTGMYWNVIKMTNYDCTIFLLLWNLKNCLKKNLFQTRRLIMMNLKKLRKLPTKELLNRDYYRGRFAIKTLDQKSIFNWEDYS